MQHLKVSGAVRPLKWSLGVKWLSFFSFTVNPPSWTLRLLFTAVHLLAPGQWIFALHGPAYICRHVIVILAHFTSICIDGDKESHQKFLFFLVSLRLVAKEFQLSPHYFQ